jgi:hypothetical protein
LTTIDDDEKLPDAETGDENGVDLAVLAGL